MGSFKDIRPRSRCASSLSSASPISTSNSQIEILYSLPNARIVEFKPSDLNFMSVARSETAVIEAEPGTLSWVSRFERTIAVGSLHIYRAPGSVAFINCQNAIRPILPRSQAWCVDGESKFVLRSPPLFWRIELPNMSHDEVLRVEELKRILDQILRFEKTPCPFRRNFSIELKPPPQTPVKKKQWKALDKREISEKKDFEITKSLKKYNVNFNSLIVPSPKVNSLSKSNVSLDNCSKSSEKSAGSVSLRNDFSVDIHRNISNELSEQNLKCHDSERNTHSQIVETPYLSSISKTKSGLIEDKPCLPEQEQENRNTCLVLQPIQRPLTSTSRQSLGNDNISEYWEKSSISDYSVEIEGNRSRASSSASFYSLKSRHSPLKTPSSFPKATTNSEISRCSYPNQNFSQPPAGMKFRGNISPNTCSRSSRLPDNSSVEQELDQNLSLILKTPITSDDCSEKSDYRILKAPALATPKEQKQSPENNKSLDEVCYSKNSSISPAVGSKMLQLAHSLPITIIQKTFEIFFKPPSHLLQLMLRIASRIALGEWHGVLTNYGEPIHWDFEEDYGESDNYNENGSSEDDYGNPYFSVNLISSSASRGWEVD